MSLVDTSSFEESKIVPLFGSNDAQSKYLPLKALAIEDSGNFGQNVYFFGESYDRKEYFLHFTENIFETNTQNKNIARLPVRAIVPEVSRLNCVTVYRSKNEPSSRP